MLHERKTGKAVHGGSDLTNNVGGAFSGARRRLGTCPHLFAATEFIASIFLRRSRQDKTRIPYIHNLKRLIKNI